MGSFSWSGLRLCADVFARCSRRSASTACCLFIVCVCKEWLPVIDRRLRLKDYPTSVSTKPCELIRSTASPRTCILSSHYGDVYTPLKRTRLLGIVCVKNVVLLPGSWDVVKETCTPWIATGRCCRPSPNLSPLSTFPALACTTAPTARACLLNCTIWRKDEVGRKKESKKVEKGGNCYWVRGPASSVQRPECQATRTVVPD